MGTIQIDYYRWIIITIVENYEQISL